jgi:hypothetical protein
MHKLRALACALFVVIGLCACATTDTAAPEVHVIGVYEGSYPPNAGHGSSRPYQIDIAVRERKHPVVLVLMSYPSMAHLAGRHRCQAPDTGRGRA